MTDLRLNARRPAAGVYILITLLTVLVFSTRCTNSVAPVPPPKTYCQQFQDYLAASGFEYDSITVPEDYDNPQGPLIQVFYYRQKNLAGTPIAVFNGGPSHSSHGTSQAIKEHQSQRTERGSLPFVYIDQRGTGCSTNYPNAVDEKDFDRLLNYSSKNIVRDSEKIRQKLLGDKKWKVFGQSYGGVIVHRYILDYPKSVESAHVHGLAIGISGEESTYRRIKSQYRVMEEYLRRFPEDKEVLNTLGKELGELNCYSYKASASVTTEFCGPIILHRLISMLGFSDGWTALHLWLADFLNSTGQVSQSAIQDFVNRDLGPGTMQDEIAWNSLPALLISYVDGADRGFTFEVCKETHARLKANSLGQEPWYLDECRGVLKSSRSEEDIAFQQTMDTYLKRVRTEVMSLEDLRDAIDRGGLAGKFYLYSGELDTFVPKEIFAEEVSFLGDRVKYHHFQSSGHEGFLEPLVWKNLRK